VDVREGERERERERERVAKVAEEAHTLTPEKPEDGAGIPN
jgi:hypothetical protein